MPPCSTPTTCCGDRDFADATGWTDPNVAASDDLGYTAARPSSVQVNRQVTTLIDSELHTS